MQQNLFQALLEPDAPVPAEVMVWNGSDPAVRFAIYRNNVLASLIDALMENFPVLVNQVGEEFFRAMASVFVRQKPPTSPILADYGGTFPAWIAAFPPLQEWPWLADLARLEMLFIASLHSADASPPPLTDVTPQTDPARIYARFHPSVRLLRSPWAVLSLWMAYQQQRSSEEVDLWRPEHMLLFRLADNVRIVSLSDAEWQFVTALQTGKSLGQAFEQARSADMAFDPQQILVDLKRNNIILSLSCGKEEG